MGQVLFPTVGGTTPQDLCFLPALFPAAQLQNLEEISCGSGITNRGGEWHLSLKAVKTVVCLLVPARPSFPAQSLN